MSKRVKVSELELESNSLKIRYIISNLINIENISKENIRLFIDKCRRIDAKRLLNTPCQNILNRYHKLKVKVDGLEHLSDWNIICLLLIYYSINEGIISQEEGDISIYFNIDNKMLYTDERQYTKIYKDFYYEIGLDIEDIIYMNSLLLLLSICIYNKDERELVESFLEGTNISVDMLDNMSAISDWFIKYY